MDNQESNKYFKSLDFLGGTKDIHKRFALTARFVIQQDVANKIHEKMKFYPVIVLGLQDLVNKNTYMIELLKIDFLLHRDVDLPNFQFEFFDISDIEKFFTENDATPLDVTRSLNQQYVVYQRSKLIKVLHFSLPYANKVNVDTTSTEKQCNQIDRTSNKDVIRLLNTYVRKENGQLCQNKVLNLLTYWFDDFNNDYRLLFKPDSLDSLQSALEQWVKTEAYSKNLDCLKNLLAVQSNVCQSPIIIHDIDFQIIPSHKIGLKLTLSIDVRQYIKHKLKSGKQLNDSDIDYIMNQISDKHLQVFDLKAEPMGCPIEFVNVDNHVMLKSVLTHRTLLVSISKIIDSMPETDGIRFLTPAVMTAIANRLRIRLIDEKNKTLQDWRKTYSLYTKLMSIFKQTPEYTNRKETTYLCVAGQEHNSHVLAGSPMHLEETKILVHDIDHISMDCIDWRIINDDGTETTEKRQCAIITLRPNTIIAENLQNYLAIKDELMSYNT